MQMQPYQRSEALPAPLPEKPGPLAERTGLNGSAGITNGNGVPHPAALSSSGLPPTYFQVLFQQILKRKKLLAFWLAATALVAAAAIKTFGKPVWRAEGSLYYAPNFSYSNQRLYTPPNIQTMIALIKSGEVLEKLRREQNLGVGIDVLQNRLTVSTLRQSDIITVSLDWPDRWQVETLTDRLMELAIEHHEHMRLKLAAPNLTDLEETLKKTLDEEIELRGKLDESMGKQGIFDLRIEKDNVIRNIESLMTQIDAANSEKRVLEGQVEHLDARIKSLKMNPGSDGMPEDESKFRNMHDILRSQITRQREIEQAKVELNALLNEKKQSEKVFNQGAISRQEWTTLLAKIKKQELIIAGNQDIQANEEKLKQIEKELLDKKSSPTSQMMRQLAVDKMQKEVLLESKPRSIKDLEASLAARRERQRFLQNVETKTLVLQKQIEDLEKKRVKLTSQKEDHEKIKENKFSELTIHSKAGVGASPVSTNHLKLGAAIFALSMFLFVGLVAVRDMPKLPRPVEAPPAEPKPSLPAPAWSNGHYPPPAPAAPRSSPEQSAQHLRALAERIAQGISERGSIVLFTPAVAGLRVESLVGDLGCYYAQLGGRVLVFDARPATGSASVPAWAGPRAPDIGAEVENYLLGRTDRPAACFTATLISSIEYSRGDLFTHLNGVIAMYRFRRLVEEMKERYSLVLLITPDMYRATDDDFLGTLAEGVVVVLNEGVNPADVDAYIQNLRASETPVYGAVTVPS